MFDLNQTQLFQVSEEWLAGLIFKNKRHLTFISVSLNQVCHVPLAVKKSDNQHLNKDVCRVYSGKNSFYRVLPLFPVSVVVIFVNFRSLEDNAIGT